MNFVYGLIIGFIIGVAGVSGLVNVGSNVVDAARNSVQEAAKDAK